MRKLRFLRKSGTSQTRLGISQRSFVEFSILAWRKLEVRFFNLNSTWTNISTWNSNSTWNFNFFLIHNLFQKQSKFQNFKILEFVHFSTWIQLESLPGAAYGKKGKEEEGMEFQNEISLVDQVEKDEYEKPRFRPASTFKLKEFKSGMSTEDKLAALEAAEKEEEAKFQGNSRFKRSGNFTTARNLISEEKKPRFTSARNLKRWKLVFRQNSHFQLESQLEPSFNLNRLSTWNIWRSSLHNISTLILILNCL